MDMADYTLPPAGTETYPFIGNFNGNGVAINNLTISNAESGLTDVPKQASISDGLLDGAKFVGFFGIVGQYETSISYDTSINAIDDLYFDNLTVESGASKTLAGFIAGYANGKINNCGIHCGQFSFAKGSSGLTDGASISKYTIFGDCGDNLEWTNKPVSGGSDTGGNWGGSIDMTTLTKRLYYMAGTGYAKSSTLITNEEFDFASKTAPAYSKDKYNVYYRSNSLTGTSIWNSTMGTIQYLYDGTYLPLNVDTETSFQGDEVDPTHADDSSNWTATNWKTTEWYKSHTSEYSLISNTNTGYLVGGGVPKDQYGGLPDGKDAKYIYLRKEMSFSSNLNNSITLGSIYDKDKVKIFSVNTVSGTTTEEITDSSKYIRYSTVKANFDGEMNGDSYAYAIRFTSINVNDSTNNWSNKITVKINGAEKQNYQFLKSAINFTVNKPGYITVIISSWRDMGTKMFDLFKINRNADNSINEIKRISKIYGEANSGTYYYGYSLDDANDFTYDDTSKCVDGSLLFNFGNTHGLSTNRFYYFEIPVNAGDYAIGKYSSTEKEGEDTSTGYLNYLDIGANAGKSDTGDKTVKATNIDFVYEDSASANGLAQIDATGYVSSGVVFSISGTPSDAAKLLYFKRDSNGNAQGTDVGVIYYTASGYTITPAGNGASTNKDPSSKEEGEA